MALYINKIPTDRAGNPLQDFPAPVRAVTSVMMRENAVASSVLLLDQNATSVEVTALGGQGIAIRWVLQAETPAVSPRGSVIASGLGANFDHIIPAGTVRRFAIPNETNGVGVGGPVGAGIGSVYGLYSRLAQINAGIVASSVLVAQY